MPRRWLLAEKYATTRITAIAGFTADWACATSPTASGSNPGSRFSITWALGSTELAANLFRATQTEEKLRRENVRHEDHANRIHNEVGRKVRRTIHELGGTIPENLPIAESIKKVESRERKRLKAW